MSRSTSDGSFISTIPAVSCSRSRSHAASGNKRRLAYQTGANNLNQGAS
jgi:hypothetical protein